MNLRSYAMASALLSASTLLACSPAGGGSTRPAAPAMPATTPTTSSALPEAGVLPEPADPADGAPFGPPYAIGSGHGRGTVRKAVPAGSATSVLVRFSCAGSSGVAISSDAGNHVSIRSCDGVADVTFSSDMRLKQKRPTRWTVAAGPNTAWRVAIIAHRGELPESS